MFICNGCLFNFVVDIYHGLFFLYFIYKLNPKDVYFWNLKKMFKEKGSLRDNILLKLILLQAE